MSRKEAGQSNRPLPIAVVLMKDRRIQIRGVTHLGESLRADVELDAVLVVVAGS